LTDTFLELLVDVVDVVLKESGIDEKFLGITLFALVPNTTEFMNAMSFALNGNIALSMEIGSAYALQVCLLQIPAMVAFSAWYYPDKIGEAASTFTYVFQLGDKGVVLTLQKAHFPSLGRDRNHSLHVLDDLHLHRGQE